MDHLNVAFDVDGTLITGRDTPNDPVIALLKWFLAQNHNVHIWSGGGLEYTQHWADKLGFHGVRIIEKSKQSAMHYNINLTVDDMPVEFGQGILNIQV